jgi:hypothetical protein
MELDRNRNIRLNSHVRNKPLGLCAEAMQTRRTQSLVCVVCVMGGMMVCVCVTIQHVMHKANFQQ